ncbi:MAG: hypothetical protein ABSD67_06000 [Terracidiphilus sp.]
MKPSVILPPFNSEGSLPETMASLEGLTEWTERHNRWADAEVSELLDGASFGSVQPNILRNPMEKKRFLRKVYNDAPLFIRPFPLFFYRYFTRLGFLDGVEAFLCASSFWFRFLQASGFAF